MPFLMHVLIDLFHDSKSSNIISQADLTLLIFKEKIIQTLSLPEIFIQYLL